MTYPKYLYMDAWGSTMQIVVVDDAVSAYVCVGVWVLPHTRYLVHVSLCIFVVLVLLHIIVLVLKCHRNSSLMCVHFYIFVNDF